MKTILAVLAKGDAKDRLAVIADIATLAGVSVATVTAGVLTLVAGAGKVDVENLLGAIIFSLFGLAIGCCIVAAFIWVVVQLSKPWKAPRGVQSLLICAAWLIFFIIVLYAVSFFYSLISSLRVLG
ncbi:hypothetical protein [Pseudescherichia sp.]|uniref:hypothetical protein n=1 Tax=Pseudescherichia sp. TaxID=2055881 RepID=UPI0028AA94D8|nr:hypothetical protein [Pseudescherichia sp.]